MALINCPECGKEISNSAEKCIHCGYPLMNIKTNTSSISTTNKGYNCCPHCKSSNYHSFLEEKVKYGKEKSKTKTTLNLNPLKPFTIVDQKTITVPGKPKVSRTTKFQCDNCGRVFLFPGNSNRGCGTAILIWGIGIVSAGTLLSNLFFS